MIDPNELRALFYVFLGEEEFHKFLDVGVSRHRLRFWQEQVLHNFLLAHPILNVGFNDLWESLHICPLHYEVLLQETVQLVEGCPDLENINVSEDWKKFPCAKLDVMYSGGASGPKSQVVDYCNQCRAAWNEYQSQFLKDLAGKITRLHPTMLVGETTLEDYLSLNDQVDAAKLSKEVKAKFRQSRIDVNSLMEPGDTIWRWSSSEHYRGTGGIALLRGDIVIKIWRYS